MRLAKVVVLSDNLWEQLSFVNMLVEALLIGIFSSFDEWSWAFSGGVMWYTGMENPIPFDNVLRSYTLGGMSRKKDLSGRGSSISGVRVICLCVILTDVNSQSRLVMILLFIILKTFYLNAAPHFFWVRSMLPESVVVTHIACEKLTMQVCC